MELIADYFLSRKFKWINGAPLVAPTSTTVPFCISGGVPYEAMIAGDVLPTLIQFANLQTCIRTAKLDSVGYTGRHHICFDMLGHFMLGVANAKDTKVKMIETAHFLLSNLGIEKNRIAVTTDIEDFESQEIWNKLGVKLFTLPNKKVIEARHRRSGFQTEIMYKIGEGFELDAYRELWNIVIYQFATPNFTEPLPFVFADSGASLDRIISAREGVTSNYQNSIWFPFLSALGFNTISPDLCRIAEFMKAVVYLSAEPNFYPSNKGAEYEFRKLIRKMFVLCETQDLDWEYLFKKTDTYFNTHASYATVLAEVTKFKGVLIKGYKACQKNKQTYTEELATQMYESHGFPKELFSQIKLKGGIKWIEKLKQ